MESAFSCLPPLVSLILDYAAHAVLKPGMDVAPIARRAREAGICNQSPHPEEAARFARPSRRMLRDVKRGSRRALRAFLTMMCYRADVLPR